MNDKRQQFYQTGLSMLDNFFGKEVLVAIETKYYTSHFRIKYAMSQGF